MKPHRPATGLTELGVQYARASGQAKEDLNLALLRAFHPYLYKYLDMIVRGHLPRYGMNINDDAKKLLQIMVPKGSEINKYTLMHRAFKGYEPEEIYNVLATCLVRVISTYNPFYVEKVKEVVDTIQYYFATEKAFSITELNEQLPFLSKFVVWMLVKCGHLVRFRIRIALVSGESVLESSGMASVKQTTKPQLLAFWGTNRRPTR